MQSLALLLAVILIAPQPAQATEVAPAIKRVITMLDNLVTELEAEAKDDEAKITHYTDWATKEITDTGIEVEQAQGEIEMYTSTLAELNAKKDELTAAVKKLNEEVSATQSAIDFATNKRNDEKSAFVAEQQDFAAAILACGKAVKLLAAHYGDGSAAPGISKPDFVALVQTVQRAPMPKGPAAQALRRLVLLQGPSGSLNNDRYSDSSEEALSVVDQIKVLKSSFEEDKQSAVEDEARLQGMYDKLMKEKTESLTTLKAERDSQQSRLQTTNQEIAENEGALSRTERILADAQAHLAQTTKSRDEAVEAYGIRKKDREEETEAVKHAVSVLEEWRSASFVQTSTLLTRGRGGNGKSAGRGRRAGSPDKPCPHCDQAAKLLQMRAAALGSSMLKAAAMATVGLDALDDIVNSLDGLIDNLKEEQKSEKEHKEWCEKELGLTTKKRDDHSQTVEEIKAILANLGEVVKEKEGDLVVNDDTTNTEDTGFTGVTKLREEDETEYEKDSEDHKDAILALNEAIDILSKYYQNKAKKDAASASLLQVQDPQSGGSAVALISGTRNEFEQSLTHIESEEKDAEKLYTETKAMHVKTDNDLFEEKDTITVEKQTVEAEIEQSEEDKTTNEAQVESAKSYLDRLGKSCYPLLSRYDERKKMRGEEKKALEDAIDVLKEAA